MLRLSERYTEEFRLLIEELRRYFQLEKRLLTLELTEKVANLIAGLLVVIIGVLLGGIALLMLTFALAYWIATVTQSVAAGFLIIAAAVVLLLVIVIAGSRRWILRPIIHMVADIFLYDNDQQHESK